MASDKIKSNINKTINELVQNMEPSGLVLVAFNDDVIYQKCFGYADRTKNIPMTLDKQFLVGSVTKQFTGVAILKGLLDKNTQSSIDVHNITKIRGNIQADLDKSISYYLPNSHPIWAGTMPAWANTVTVHQLLVHSSGIPNYTSLPDFEKQIFPKPSDLVSFFKSLELEFTPGTKFSYCNSGYFLLGIIAQHITKQDLDAYMLDRFFKPLEMWSTFLATKGTVNKLIQSDARFKNLARGYKFESSAQIPSIDEVNNYVSMQVPGAGGSLISTALDLLKWNNALYSGKIIPEYLLELLLQPHMPTEMPNEYYGYGIEIKQPDSPGKYYTHRGGIPGFHSMLTYMPKLQLSVVILENIVVDQEKLAVEIEKIKAGFPQTLSFYEKVQQIDKILEKKYPCIITNKQHFQLAPIHDAIIKTVNITDPIPQ